MDNQRQVGLIFEINGKTYTIVGSPGMLLADVQDSLPEGAGKVRELTPEEITELDTESEE